MPMDIEVRDALRPTRRVLGQAERLSAGLTEAGAHWGDVDNFLREELETLAQQVASRVAEIREVLAELYPTRRRAGGKRGAA